MNYDSIIASPDGDAFELRGSRVKVLSENELLTATGQVVHTGRSDPVVEEFARNFSNEFVELTARDTNFADLAGIFDLAVVAGLISSEQLHKRVGWSITTWLDPDEYIVPIGPAPRSVESVINHRVYRGRHILALVSGGVIADPWKTTNRERRRIETPERLRSTRAAAIQPRDTARRSWWD